MQPIDKFNLENYVKEEDELLEYIVSIADEYAPSVDYENRCQSHSNAPYVFQNRYNSGEIWKNIKFSFEDYVNIKDNNIKDIQDTITALNIDPIKFWYLLLFICDFCNGHCVEGTPQPNFARNELEKFVTAFRANINVDNGKFSKPCEIVMKMKGKTVTVSNPKSIEFIINACENAVNQIKNDNSYMEYMPLSDTKKISTKSAPVAIFANMMFSFFKSNPQFKGKRTKGKTIDKKLFISSLIYMTKTSDNEEFYGNMDILKGYLKLSKNKIENQINAYYPS